MFVKCAACGYLTPDNSPLCKQCGAGVGRVADPAVTTPAPPALVDPKAEPSPRVSFSSEAEAWLAATVPPPDSSTAAPPPQSPVAPPRPPTPTPSSMFPTPAARPPRRSIPTWTVASAAVLIVAALIAGVIATKSGGNNRSQKRADAAQAALTVQRSQIDNAEQSLISRSDLGSRWTDLGTSGATARDLRWDEPCSDDPALDTLAKFGRTRGFSYDLSDDNTEHGHLSSSVFHYASAAKAKIADVARRQPDFAACVNQFNTAYLSSPETTGIVGDGATQTITPDAVVYHETMHYVYQGTPATMDFWTVYYLHGAFRGTLTFSGGFQQGYADELISVSKQRLDVHTPR